MAESLLKLMLPPCLRLTAHDFSNMDVAGDEDHKRKGGSFGVWLKPDIYMLQWYSQIHQALVQALLRVIPQLLISTLGMNSNGCQSSPVPGV